MPLKIFVPLLSFFVLFVSECRGGRNVLLPPYSRQVTSDGTKLTIPSGTKVGYQMLLNLTLVNLSQTDQTGKILVVPGSYASGYESGRSPNFGAHWFLCNGPTGVGGAGRPTSEAPSLSLNFSLTKGATGIYVLGVVFNSPFGPATNQHDFLDATLSPIVQIAIDQDRGAMQGTMVPTVGGVTGIPGTSTCDGGFDYTNVVSLPLPVDRSGVPLLINGGRPF